jgi:hypothetical protein
MRIHPNRSLVEAQVLAIRRARDGYGADVDLRVSSCTAATPDEDFIRAAAGQLLTAFTAIPEALATGGRYRIEASLLGDARGERVVVQRVLATLEEPARTAPAAATRGRRGGKFIRQPPR